jgi:hypothetical protein
MQQCAVLAHTTTIIFLKFFINKLQISTTWKELTIPLDM